MTKAITAIELAEMLEQAVKTLKLQPKVGPKNKFCAWPDVVWTQQERWAGYGGDAAQDRLAATRMVATARQMTELDMVMDLMQVLPQETRCIVWARADGHAWRPIARIVGKAPNTCRMLWRVALVTMAAVHRDRLRDPLKHAAMVDKVKAAQAEFLGRAN